MTKKRSTRRALALSLISLLLCVSMFVGTTFAWFTDSVSSLNNKIVAGNLDVELYYQVEGQSDWTKVTSTTNIFKENTLWEPGHTEVVKLKVVNEGTLALKYQLGVNIASETGSVNVYGREFELSDFIKFGVVDGAQSYTRDQAIAAVDATATTLKTAYGSGTVKLEAKNDTNSDEKIVTMVVYMPETVGNEANYRGDKVPTITLGINLFATQVDAESDSFGTDYDAEAWAPGMLVYNASDLKAAIHAGGNVTLMDDIQLTEKITANKDAVINLNGNTITGTGNTIIEAIASEVTVKNGKLVYNGTVSAIDVGAGATLTLEDAVIESTADGIYDMGGGNNTIVIKSGSISATGIAVAVDTGTTLTINGGTFTGAEALYAWNEAEVAVTGGTFNGLFCGSTKTAVTGGVFTDNYVSNYVASGFKAIEKDGKYFVVAGNVDSLVLNATDMKAAIENGGTVAVMNDIDMANSWTSVKPNAELTILGNGKTITNLNLPLLAGGVSTKVTFKGLTVADSNVAPAAFENGLGTGAFVPYVDAYGNVAFEDCHLVNSTVTGNERAGGFIGYTSGQTLSFKNCTVDKCEISAVGGAAGLVAYSQTATTIDGCSVTNTKVTATEDRLGTKAALAGSVIGTVNADTVINNVTASGNTVSNNNAKPVFNDCIGRWVAGDLTIDGSVYIAKAEKLASAVAKENATVVLGSGDFGKLSAIADGVTIIGNGETTFEADNGNVLPATLNNVTFKGVNLSGNNVLQGGIANGNVTFEDCVISGDNFGIHFDSGNGTNNIVFRRCKITGFTTFAATIESVVFEGCEFINEATHPSGATQVNIWGGEATFKDCHFDEFFWMIFVPGDATINIDGVTYDGDINDFFYQKSSANVTWNFVGTAYTVKKS